MIKIKFENNEKFLKVLKSMENVINVNSDETKLKFIKFGSINRELCITAINPSTRIMYCPKDIQYMEGDSVLYDVKKLISLLSVAKGNVTIDGEEIKSNKCKYKISFADAIDYPGDILPEITNYSEINTDEFIEGLNSTILATDKVIIEGAMSGVYLNNNKMMACDSQRLFTYQIELKENMNNVILPKNLIKEVLRLPWRDKLYFTQFGERIIITDGDITITSNKLNKEYPKVENILPSKVKNEMTIDKNEFYNALLVVMPVLDDYKKICNLEYSNDKMQIFINNGKESAKTEIPIKIKNEIEEPIHIKFNMQFLLDVIKASKEEIKIKTFTENLGYMFESGKAMQFIMPMI